MAVIVMLLSNPYRPDQRVEREAHTLIKLGYNLTIVCWDRENKFPSEEMIEGINIIRIQTVPSTYGYGWRQLFHIPRFWITAWHLIKKLRPDVVHSHDMDTLPLGIWVKIRLGCKLIFDAHEDYPSLMTLYLPKIMVNLLKILEHTLIKKVDATITASNILAEKYRLAGVSPVVTIGNYTDLGLYNSISSTEILQARSSLKYSPDDYIVAYIGGFSKNRLIIPLIQALQMRPEIKLLLAGDGHQRIEVEKLVSDIPNIQYIGWITSGQVALFTLMSDVIYYCLLPNYPGAIYNAPNTLSNAMAAGKPIIANDVGDLGRIVKDVGCGILIDTVNPYTIASALDSLRDKELRQRLGQFGKSAAQNEYNWACAETKIANLYKHLFSP